MPSFRNMHNQVMPGMQMPYGGCSCSQQALPPLPSGMPTGPTPTPLPAPNMVQVAPPGQQAPQTVESPLYTPGFLRTQIGKRMRVEFLIGTGALIDRIGTLVGVGASYILLMPTDTDDIMMCDIYSIKFVTIYY